jgi:hypothetical protein
MTSRHWRIACRLVCVLALAFVTSYCTPGDNQTEIMELSGDETYLVESYIKAREARDLYSVNDLQSDSLFAVLDSTLDTLRIANTIRTLNQTPDRWVLVFRSIEEKAGYASEPPGPDNRGSEEGR